MTDPVPTPGTDPAPQQQQPTAPIRLPDDHPLVTAFTAQKDKNAGLQSQIDTLTSELAQAKQPIDPNQPEWQKKFEDLETQLAAEREAREKAEKVAADAARVQHGIDEGLPKAAAELLIGLPADKVAAKIDELKPLFAPGGPTPNPQQGNPSRGHGGSLAAGRERYAQQHTK